MAHDHSEHHRERIIGNLVQAEDHLRSDYCPECLDKHLISAGMYMEEQASTNPEKDRKLMEYAERIREIRRKIQEMNDIKHENDKRRLSSTI